jgi:uracil phosphoribosyltransferase
MLYELSNENSILSQFLAEMRDQQVQVDAMRFRKNLERTGQVMAYEISKQLDYESRSVETPLGTAEPNLPSEQIVLATVLRAGLPLHQGMLSMLDKADNAFVSAYRKHHKDGSFEVHVEYVSCPSIEDKVLVIADPMIATGSSLKLAADALMEFGSPKQLHFVSAIAASEGIEYLERYFPDAHIWTIDVDDELTAKSYIVPGLGDAGDLAFGEKLQE